MTTEERINKTLEPLDNAIKAFKKVVRRVWPKEELDLTPEEHTEAHDKSPDLKEINFNKPWKRK